MGIPACPASQRSLRTSFRSQARPLFLCSPSLLIPWKEVSYWHPSVTYAKPNSFSPQKYPTAIFHISVNGRIILQVIPAKGPNCPLSPLSLCNSHDLPAHLGSVFKIHTESFHFSSALFLLPDQAAIIFGLGYCASLILTNLPASVPALLPPPDTVPAPHRLCPLHAAVGAVLCSEPSPGFLCQLE